MEIKLYNHHPCGLYICITLQFVIANIIGTFRFFETNRIGIEQKFVSTRMIVLLV